MLSVKVSTKHQVVVPSSARRALGIEAGDRLDVEVTPEAIVLRPRARRAGARLRGLGSQIWQGLDPVEYLATARRAGATGFVTNDQRIRGRSGVEIIRLARLTGS